MLNDNDDIIYENDLLYICIEESEIPWLKIFSKQDCKELSDCDNDSKNALFNALDTIEKTMISFYRPEKINIALFGNYLPKLHIHIMARFKEDSYFPEPMWGKKLRESSLDLPDFDRFIKLLTEKL